MAVKSHDESIDELLKMIDNGKIQLPEFQRSWVWDNNQVCKLIESITSGYPMGAAMFLANGGEYIRFECRKFTGVEESLNVTPDWLVLDGQQRLTTLYQVFKSKNAALTRLYNDKDKTVRRYYYLDIEKCLDPTIDRLDAIVTVPQNKIVTDIAKNVIRDLSTREKEIEQLMFPLNITFSTSDTMDWQMQLWNVYINNNEKIELYKRFYSSIIQPIISYKIPVIELDKDTPREAVCQIFENVNTGGVPLTVFELVTATFAADKYDLRADWDEVKKSWNTNKQENLKDTTGANYLAAMTLLVTYIKSIANQGTISCKKRDILKLDLSDYQKYRNVLLKGFEHANAFLVQQGIYRVNDLPYTSQLIPLAAIFAFDETQKGGKLLNIAGNIQKLAQWYWCGVFGELYGGANEARFALDIANVISWLKGGELPDTVNRANFQPTRLLSMQTRNSAAYKGVMAVIMHDSPLDFMTGEKMDVASYINKDTDIHHIFPQEYCKKQKLPEKKWNCVVNKTPIYASTNRSIGGRAPSEYVKTMQNKGLSSKQITDAILSHKIAPAFLMSDAFDDYFIDRAKQILNRIEKAIGKTISGRDSEETVREFGKSLK